MVEQESLQGQQYLASQQRTESKLNSSVGETWLTTADITYLNEITGISHINSIMESSHLEEKNDISDNILCKIEMDNLPCTNFVAKDPNSVDVTYTDFYDSCDANAEMNAQNFDYTCDSPLSLWNSFVDLNNFKIDDVFQVDTADLFQGPTLAELNANDESLFDSLDSFESYLPSEDNTLNFQFQAANSSGILAELDAENHHKEKVEDPQKYSTVIPDKEKLLMKISPETASDFYFGSTVTTSNSNSVNSDKANLPCIKSEDTMFQAVPTRVQDCKPVSWNSEKCGVNVSGKRQANLSNTKKQDFASTSHSWNECETVSSFCNDDEMDSQDDITDDEVFSSDDDFDVTEQPSRKRISNDDSSSSKKARYFWQYNIQAKGPKRPKMKSTFAHSDDVSSLVKVRRGDCNDLTPSPQKLYNIGIELQKLNSVISDLTPVNELPFNARPNSRKEKNKLASRACRLKKKAQHEANKLKFFGLRQEQDSLNQIMNESKKILKTKLCNLDSSISCGEQLEALLALKDTIKVAGCSADFVNEVLKNVEAGDPKGGLSNL